MSSSDDSREDKRENGSAMLAIGWVLVLFASLVFFFHPAGLKLGETRFAVIAGCLADRRLDARRSGHVDTKKKRVASSS